MTKIIPVLLSGGSGTRLWPLSRQSSPKQLAKLIGSETMLQQTARRVSDPQLFEPPLVIASAEHRFLVAEQLRTVDIANPRLVLEPEGRNTAAAAAAAALIAQSDDADALILLLPSDHAIGDTSAFLEAVRTGALAARKGALTLFGIKPVRPETGYGYILTGDALPGVPGACKVVRFTEKPDLAAARQYLASGDYAWNSGIFLLPAGAFLEDLQRFEPELVRACRSAVDGIARDNDFCWLEPEAFRAAPSISIDHAVMERTERAAVVPVSFGWSDVGAWSALWELEQKDNEGNAVLGDAIAEGVTGSYLRGDGVLVAAIGVTDLIVVATPDAVLVTSKATDQGVKTIVDRLRSTGRRSRT